MVAKKFSPVWKSSSNSRKQRKYAHQAPNHVKHKLASSGLSKELRKQHGVRSLPVRKGDVVKVLTGQFKGKSGKVTKVSLAKTFAHVEGCAVKRADATEALYPIHPSNLQITSLDLADKTRVAKIEKMKASKNVGKN
jgi:large subunit ribosomal protein L24